VNAPRRLRPITWFRIGYLVGGYILVQAAETSEGADDVAPAWELGLPIVVLAWIVSTVRRGGATRTREDRSTQAAVRRIERTLRWLGPVILLVVVPGCSRADIALRCPERMTVGERATLTVAWVDPGRGSAGPLASWSQEGTGRGSICDAEFPACAIKPFNEVEYVADAVLFLATTPGEARINAEAEWTTGEGFWDTEVHQWSGDCSIEIVER